VILPLFHALWKYRTEILLAAQLLNALRKTARETAREYIRRRAKEKLTRQILVLSSQVILFLVAYLWCRQDRSLAPRLFASTVLWGVTLYNLFDWIFFTIPELLAVRRALKGKIGYAFKYFLGVSVATELMEGNILFLAFCVFLGLSSRTLLGITFQYFEPWAKFFAVFTLNS
jgi:hypothetical protein